MAVSPAQINDIPDCAIGCPCNFGSDSTLGYCEGVLTWLIRDGNYGDLKISKDLAIVLIIHWEGRSAPHVPTAIFLAGYLIAWAIFSLIATALQWLLQTTGLLTTIMQSASYYFSGALFLASALGSRFNRAGQRREAAAGSESVAIGIALIAASAVTFAAIRFT